MQTARKRIFSLVLSIALILGMMTFIPTTAYAATTGSIKIHDVEVVSDILQNDGNGTGWSWTASSTTLTLDSQYSGSDKDIYIECSASDNINLVLTGDVTISNAPFIAINVVGLNGGVGGSLTVKAGSFTLNATSGSSGLHAHSGVIIESGTVVATGEVHGICSSYGGVTISGSANVTAIGTVALFCNGIQAKEDVIISTSSTVEVVSARNGIVTADGDITISSGTVSVIAKGTGYALAADHNGSVNISNGTVTARNDDTPANIMMGTLTLNHTGGTFNGVSAVTATTTPPTLPIIIITPSDTQAPATPTPTQSPIPTPIPTLTPAPTQTPVITPTPKPSPTPVAPIKVTGVNTLPSLYIALGKTATLPFSIEPANAANKAVTWSSKNTQIATVDSKGVVKGVRTGTTTLTVKSADGGKTATCTVYVIVKTTALKSVTVWPDKPTAMLVGKTLQITTKMNPAKPTGIVPTYQSSDKKVATVDAMGKVSALAVGKATITVSAGSIKKTFVLTVGSVAPSKITLSETSITIKQGGTYTLAAPVFTPASTNPKTITWTTSNAAIATVSGSGVVTGVKKGQVTITATTWNGKTAECVITVQ